jgi:hypothetical protein
LEGKGEEDGECGGEGEAKTEAGEEGRSVSAEGFFDLNEEVKEYVEPWNFDDIIIVNIS